MNTSNLCILRFRSKIILFLRYRAVNERAGLGCLRPLFNFSEVLAKWKDQSKNGGK